MACMCLANKLTAFTVHDSQLISILNAVKYWFGKELWAVGVGVKDVLQ